MRKTLLILICLIASTAIMAQTQQGYVKTKGRLGSNGQVIAGSRIPGATIQVKGRTAVVSQGNGTFSFPIPAQSFYVQSVQKQGYVLTDPDVLSRQYAYSANPLILVLETPEQQTDDKLAAEQKIRRTLRRQLQEKEDEIEALKEQNKLTEEEYRRQLQDLYAKQEDNERLIKEMAERYSQMDFDAVDEFNRRISDCILNGRLTEADSLLRTKGDITTRAANLRQLQEANQQTEQQIEKKQKELAKSKALAQKNLEDLAQDCYSKFEIHKMQHQNDSAAHYIEFRADLDSTNVKWQLEAGEFCYKYLAKYDQAQKLYQRAYRNAVLKEGDSSILAKKCNTKMAHLLSSQGNYKQAIEIFSNNLAYYMSIQQHSLTVESYVNLATQHRKAGDFEKALELMEKASLEIKSDSDFSHIDNIHFLGNLANLHAAKKEDQKALDLYLQIIDLIGGLTNQYPIETLTTYVNIGYIYRELGNYELAMEWDMRSLDLATTLFGKQHPEIATIYNNIGNVYMSQKNMEKALEYMQKTLSIQKTIYGKNNIDIAISYNNLGRVQQVMRQYEDALKSYDQSLQILQFYDGHPLFAIVYNNLGSIYKDLKDYDKALKYFYLSLELKIKKYGEKNSNVALTLYNIGVVYKEKGDIEQAKHYLYKSRDIYAETTGTNHPHYKKVIETIEKIENHDQ